MKPFGLIGIVVWSAAFAGCGLFSKEYRHRTAIERVLKADKELGGRLETESKGISSPKQLAALIGTYCTNVEIINLSDCPADFRVAYRAHIRAWRDAQKAVSQLPDGILEGALMGFFNGLVGEFDGGASRLQGELKQAMAKVQTTFEEVEKIGAKYGAAL